MESQVPLLASSALSDSSSIAIALISFPPSPAFSRKLVLASECGVRRFGERYNCVEEGLALAQEQARIYQARRCRNRSRGVGVAGSDDRADGQALVEKSARFRHDVAAVRVLPNIWEAPAAMPSESADSLKGRLEDGEMVDLHGADGRKDCHDVEVCDLSHEPVVECVSTV